MVKEYEYVGKQCGKYDLYHRIAGINEVVRYKHVEIHLAILLKVTKVNDQIHVHVSSRYFGFHPKKCGFITLTSGSSPAC